MMFKIHMTIYFLIYIKSYVDVVLILILFSAAIDIPYPLLPISITSVSIPSLYSLYQTDRKGFNLSSMKSSTLQTSHDSMPNLNLLARIVKQPYMKSI